MKQDLPYLSNSNNNVLKEHQEHSFYLSSRFRLWGLEFEQNQVGKLDNDLMKHE